MLTVSSINGGVSAMRYRKLFIILALVAFTAIGCGNTSASSDEYLATEKVPQDNTTSRDDVIEYTIPEDSTDSKNESTLEGAMDYSEEVEYFYKDYDDPMKIMPYEIGSEENYIPLD